MSFETNLQPFFLIFFAFIGKYLWKTFLFAYVFKLTVFIWTILPSSTVGVTFS